MFWFLINICRHLKRTSLPLHFSPNMKQKEELTEINNTNIIYYGFNCLGFWVRGSFQKLLDRIKLIYHNTLNIH